MNYPLWPRCFSPELQQPIDVDQIRDFQRLICPDTGKPALRVELYGGTDLLLLYHHAADRDHDQHMIFCRLK